MTTLSQIAELLGLPERGDLEVHGVSTARQPAPETLSFMTTWSQEHAATVQANPSTIFLIPSDARSAPSNALSVQRPRLAFALATRELLQAEASTEIATTAHVDPEAQLGEGVSVGHFCVIEAGVVLEDGVVLDHHVVLKTGVEIGARSRIGSHTSIGGPGFGFEIDEDGTPIRLGHQGGVRIGADVEIGQHCSIAQGTIEPSIIADHVKIDDCVFLAHNVEVGEASFVIAGAEISGSVKIGKRAWIAPEAVIHQKVRIGDDALVGLGAVVLKDVADNTVVAGVPAKPRGLRYEL